MAGWTGTGGGSRRPAGAGTVLVLRLLFLGLLLLLWGLASATVPRGLIPSPAATAEAAARLWAEGRLQTAIGQSLLTYGTGLGAAVLVGIPLGALMGMVRLLGRTLDLFVFALAATPRVAFIPLIIVLLGLGTEAKAMIVFLGAVMPIVLNTYAGVLARDGELIEMARSTGASAARIQLHIVLPGALPFLVVGLRLGATIGPHQHRGGRALHRRDRPRRASRPLWQHVPHGGLFRDRAGSRRDRRDRDREPSPAGGPAVALAPTGQAVTRSPEDP